MSCVDALECPEEGAIKHTERQGNVSEGWCQAGRVSIIGKNIL